MEFRILDKIDSPSDLKSLTIRQLETLCEEIREYMIECCATNPGHLGASLGSVELAVALHYVLNTPEDKIVWDVGHQAYAHKIITGRRELFRLNRKKDGLSGFPKMSESPYDSFGAGHASTSVSAALGLATAAKLEGKDTKVVAVLGDGAFSGGLAYEGMNNAGAAGTDLLVILNDNQIAIDENVGAMHNYLLKMSTSKTYNSMKNKVWGLLGNGWLRRKIQKVVASTKNYFFKHSTVFSGLGFRYFGIIDGNNISDLVNTLNRIKGLKGPKLLHIRTVKGKGYKPAEENQSVWHAPGKFDIETGERVRPEKAPLKYQNIFGRTVVKLAEKDERIVGITPAMLSGGQLSDMMKAFPERTFDVGIAEEHA
ncbi:MAG: 1-deoxy-D-xylulose-5-phosphate synthase, partial [Bacteroidales bacterium]|nr:1-deoxy-D-xylulose-5-phosphate synthase [Bacteroidales bacterium]